MELQKLKFSGKETKSQNRLRFQALKVGEILRIYRKSGFLLETVGLQLLCMHNQLCSRSFACKYLLVLYELSWKCPVVCEIM